MNWIKLKQTSIPTHQVLTTDGKGKYLIGYCTFTKSGFFVCTDERNILINITHYVELDQPILIIDSPNMEINARRFIRLICDFLNVTEYDIYSKKRSRILANARKMCYKILYDKGLDKSFIGRCLNRDHSTVIDGLKKFEDHYYTEPVFRKQYDDIYVLIQQ